MQRWLSWLSVDMCKLELQCQHYPIAVIFQKYYIVRIFVIYSEYVYAETVWQKLVV